MQQQVYWIPGPWTGKIAILLRPRGGDWLEDEIAAWQAHNLHGIVSLLTPGEMYELELEQEQELLEKHGMLFFSFPIQDRSVPDSFIRAKDFVHTLTALLNQGKHIGIHCRQGIGRSSMIAASVLTHTGISANTAFQLIQNARGCPVPDTEEQRQWVKRQTVF